MEPAPQPPTIGQATQPQDLSMMPVKVLERRYEEMKVDVHLRTIKRSPMDHDSAPSLATDDDDSQHGLIIASGQDEVGTANAFTYEQSGSESTSDVSGVNQNQRILKPTFSCEVCGKLFHKRSRLSSHIIVHSEEKEFVCSVCNKGFKNKPQLRRHSNTHSAVPNFCCNICGRGFKHNDVAKHIRRFHTGPRKSKRGGIANPNAPTPNQTSFQFQTQSTNHINLPFVAQGTVYIQNQSSHQQGHPQSVIIQSQSPEDLIQVHQQGKENSTGQEYSLLQGHHQNQQNIMEPGVGQIDSLNCSSNDSICGLPTSQTLHSCLYCSQNFLSPSALASHILSHNRHREDNKKSSKRGKKRHQCGICLKTFTRASGLSGHLQLHSRTERRRQPNPNLCCHVCGKLFTRRAGLNAHVLQHGGIFRFWCDEPDCGKGFVHTYQLIRHKRLHSGALPYSCNVCGRCFRHNDLSKHMRTHTGDKPYNCQHCGKAFAFSSSLRTHERMHLAVKEHVCEICNMGFTTSAGLRRHAMCHEDEFLCPSCGKIFATKSYYSLHLQESQHCTGQQQATQVQPEQPLQQNNSETDHHLQVLSEAHAQHQVLPDVPVLTLPDMQLNEPLTIHVTHDTHNQLAHHEDARTLAALAPSETDTILSEHANPMASASIGTVPVLVPFSVSVPISVPFGININSSPPEQMQLNHFLGWEQKYCVDQ